MPLATKPLSGLKVVELGTLIAGPFASRICAEFGAQVIKIESPDGGDPLRKWRKLYEGPKGVWWREACGILVLGASEYSLLT